MTTAMRLPDPFTPDVTKSSAATPSCCCCCCCCAVSSVGALVALPAGLRHDLRETDANASSSLLALPAALFPLLVLLTIFVDTGARSPWLLLIGFPAALLWAGCASALAGAPRPWRGPVRLLIWSVSFCLEPFLVLPLLIALAQLDPVVAKLVYFGLAGAGGWLVFVSYRRRTG